ncbi:hypothetical protein A4A49_52627 [Nicotiana attenuata]|uniref:Uncharacterized protein n=1 Tax=Nicotiana attenuata TaxID=49451 RepID=A0A314KI67_NICAT|nr:hypothetical protein A4A49_52627 [Nicotiana attenuata]
MKVIFGSFQQATPASLNIGRQQAPHSSQDVGAQQETPSQDVSTEQTLASYESSNLQPRRYTTRGIRYLKVNGNTFFPHEVVRDVTIAFKKSFSGSWHCWSKVPEHVRDRWFNDFEKELTGKDLRNDGLFYKTHRTKNEKKWICRKSKDVEIIKEKVGETSTSRNEEVFEVDDAEMERNMETNGDEEGEKTNEETIVDLLKTIRDEQLLKT